MVANSVPANFDWVRGRAECSIYKVFKELLVGVRSDVETRNAIQSGQNAKWSVGAEGGKRFSVFREEESSSGALVNSSVEFILSDDHIDIVDDDESTPVSNTTPRLTGTITLNNEGLCRLKVGDLELEQWQFRRMALEPIFFDPHQTARDKGRRHGTTLVEGTY